MSVQRAVMAMSLASCLSQSVDMFNELQFCTEKVILGTMMNEKIYLHLTYILPNVNIVHHNQREK